MKRIGYIIFATLAGCSARQPQQPPPDPQYWHRLMCQRPIYRHLDTCKDTPQYEP